MLLAAVEVKNCVALSSAITRKAKFNQKKNDIQMRTRRAFHANFLPKLIPREDSLALFVALSKDEQTRVLSNQQYAVKCKV